MTNQEETACFQKAADLQKDETEYRWMSNSLGREVQHHYV